MPVPPLNNDDIFMWSPYKEKHTGVCLGFKYAIGEGLLGRAVPIRYLADSLITASSKRYQARMRVRPQNKPMLWFASELSYF